MEDWELSPQHAHPNAQALLTEPFFWDCTDDDSPWGNDAGADALEFYSEEHEDDDSAAPDAMGFLGEYLISSDLSLEPWPLPEDSDEIDIATASAAHDSVIAIAFGMYLIHGNLDPRLRTLALEMVDREMTPICLQRCSTPDQRVERLQLFVVKLNAMESV